jgi:pantetheine-phosphate adenylyltransferase
MTTIAVYPGTFDPITYGHLDVIHRAREIFDKVIVLVASNTSKSPMFGAEERLDMVKAAVKKYRNVRAENFEGLLVDFTRKKKATVIVRGLRAVSDFEYEFQMALTNRKLAGEITTVFLVPHEKFTYLNSSLVREVSRLGGNVSQFVPPHVLRALKKKLHG